MAFNFWLSRVFPLDVCRTVFRVWGASWWQSDWMPSLSRLLPRLVCPLLNGIGTLSLEMVTLFYLRKFSIILNSLLPPAS